MGNNKNLPLFGVGPIYVLICFLLTIFGILLKYKGYLKFGNVEEYNFIFIILGIFSILLGILLWVNAVIFQKINKEVKNGKLITSGVYSIVRNPIYSAFLFIFTGILFLQKNYILLVLPIVFWIFLTILMKKTEEKWLREKFGQEYIDYCNKVNRVIPWISKK